jgi:hypothetical protein
MTDKYAIYTGNNITTVSLWIRRDGNEYPIYANTRGQTEWYSHDTDVYENTQSERLSNIMVEWLAHIYRARNGLYDLDTDSMFLAERQSEIEEHAPDKKPVWYEVEILNAIDNPGMTPEQEELLKWAHNKVGQND